MGEFVGVNVFGASGVRRACLCCGNWCGRWGTITATSVWSIVGARGASYRHRGCQDQRREGGAMPPTGAMAAARKVSRKEPVVVKKQSKAAPSLVSRFKPNIHFIYCKEKGF